MEDSKKSTRWDFPGGPVAEVPCFHCRGHGFNPWSGNWDPTCHAVQPKTNKKAKTKQKNKTTTKKRAVAANGFSEGGRNRWNIRDFQGGESIIYYKGGCMSLYICQIPKNTQDRE